jgi:tetratricopeptide (TPR) repeat protein
VIATRHHLPLTVELVKWLLLMMAATALIAALATALAAEPMPEPARLPDDMGLLAKPMEVQAIKPHFPEDVPALATPPEEAAATVWMILEAQRAGRVTQALETWQRIRLPAEAEVWRQVAMAAGQLAARDLAAAEEHLGRARLLAPDNAVVAYYTGLCLLEQAAAAVRVPDELAGGDMRMVAAVAPGAAAQVPARGIMAGAVLKAMARAELHAAIARAGEVRLDERLIVGDAEMEERIVAPRVGDLLVALQADNFVGKAHHLLFGLEMDRGQLAGAEDHLDQAVATGIAPLYGYEDLAEAYLVQGQEAAALRAGQKDLAANYPLLWQAGQEMRKAIEGVWEGWVW